MNRQAIDKWARNSYQGDYRKVLCVCAGGRLRSPTAAVVLSQAPYQVPFDVGLNVIQKAEVAQW